MKKQTDNGTIRSFDTGATRDTAEGKYDYEGFLDPLVLERFAEYMQENRKQSDGSMRDSDNWQKGIPKDAYVKSGLRHFMEWWKAHRGHSVDDGLERALCGVIFNAMGYLHEILKEASEAPFLNDETLFGDVSPLQAGVASTLPTASAMGANRLTPATNPMGHRRC